MVTNYIALMTASFMLCISGIYLVAGPFISNKLASLNSSKAFPFIFGGIVSASICFLVFKNFVFSLLLILSGYLMPKKLGVRRHNRQEFLNALASVAEMLRDTILGATGLSQCLMTVANLSPLPIKPELEHLTNRIRSGLSAREAIRKLADELDDPLADSICLTLIFAVEGKVSRIADTLAALSNNIRENATQLINIDASRASVRTSTRIIIMFSVGFVAFLYLFSPSYISVYSTIPGQIALLVVLGFYLLGISSLIKMSQPKRQRRILV